MEKLGLYIHIPFCEKKCYYCDFYSITNKNYINSYINALNEEIKTHTDKKFTSVYIGGGSPSLLSAEQIKILFSALNELNLSNCEEFTIEANPSQIDFEKLNCWLNLGITRISIGVQSFNDKLLKAVGRIHSAKDAINAVNSAKKAGFQNIGLDLIYGLPYENVEDFSKDIYTAAELNVRHISAYSLMLEEKTPLYNLVGENKLILPEDDVVEEMYDMANEKFEELGYARYEVSNFAKKGYECKHNLLYWSDFPYIGVGSAAASYYLNTRYKNNCSVEEYIYKINNNLKVNAIEERTPKDALFEYIFLSLRKVVGLNKADFYKKFKKDIKTEFQKELEELKSLNLTDENEEYIYLTPKGFKISNMVFEKFISM